MSGQWERALAVGMAVLVVTATVGAATVGSGEVNRTPADGEASAEPGFDGDATRTGGVGNGSGPGDAGNATGPDGNGSAPDGNSTGNESGSSGNVTAGPGNGSGSPGNDTPADSGNDTPGGPPDDRGPPRNGHGPPDDRGPTVDVGPPETRGPPGNQEDRPGDARTRQTVQNASTSATGDSSNDTGSNATARNRTVTVENGTPLALRWTAHDLLDSADLAPGGHAGGDQSTRLQRWLNRSFPLYLDEHRVTDAGVFDDDRRVAAAASGRAPAVSAYLAASDRELAWTAIADAERVREALDDRNESYDEAAVAEDLAAAVEAFERGQRLHDRSAPAAIGAYREAWVRAQRALDRMDRAVEPTVSFDSRRDPPRNGTESYVLRGSVFDVRGHELHPLTLTLDGDPYQVALDVDTEPGSVGEFAVNLTLAPGSHRVRVNATDSNRDWADGDTHPSATGSALLRLDGDGLPDVYEERVVASDPLDPDSNASTTARDESANGVVDGLEDHDRDRAATYDEHVQDTDPLDPATDGDDLPDGFELRYASLDPLVTDTDGDGVPDPEEDPDDDTLSIAAELDNGSHPFHADTDADGLDDAAELRNGTDPTALTPTPTGCSTPRN